MKFPTVLKAEVNAIFAKLTPKEQEVLSRYIWFMMTQALAEEKAKQRII